MKVLLDYRAALVNREGIGRAARELVRALALRDEAQCVLFGSTAARERTSAEERGLDAALAAGRARLVRWRLPHRALRPLFAALGAGLDDLAPGVALVHHFQLAHLPVRRAPETATLYDALWAGAHAPWLAAADAKRMERRARALAARCARLHAPSAHAADELARVLGVPRERFDVVPLGADHLLRVPPGDAPREPFLLTVARLDARKNHVAVLRALERLHARGVRIPWVVAGPPGHGAEPFLAALARSPVRAGVRLAGALAERDLAAHYRAARAFAFPSLGEGFGLPPLEAMAFGVPTVASAAGSLDEVLGDGAWRVAPEDDAGLADALEALWTRDDERATWSARAKARATAFTWARAAEATLAAWRRALGAQPM